METIEYYRVLADAVAASASLWQVTVVAAEGSTPAKPGMKILIPLSGAVTGNLGGGELEHLIIQKIRTEQPEKPCLQTYLLSEQGDQANPENELPTSMICGGKATLFLEPLLPGRILFIVGAGHCGRALAHLAGLCGFRTRLIDNRREILDSIPTEICSDLHFSDYSDLEEHISFSTDALIVIMTHGHVHDQHVLEQCLGRPSRYLGMIGSSRKAASTLKNLEQKGFPVAELSRVHSPVGLSIGSQTPYEIAVSILAQIIRTCSGK